MSFSDCLQVWEGWRSQRLGCAGWHLFLQGMFIRPWQQQTSRHITYSCTSHTLSPTHYSSLNFTCTPQPLSGELHDTKSSEGDLWNLKQAGNINSTLRVFTVFQGDEFFCWRSAGEVCISANLKCNYKPDCEHGEDEDGCGKLRLISCAQFLCEGREMINLDSFVPRWSILRLSGSLLIFSW